MDETTVTVKVESRDLDTDARERSQVTVPARGSDALERAQLIEVVARVRPDAAIRSFAGGAATFLGRQHLVIASYAEPAKTRRARSTARVTNEQDSLFAA